MSKTQNTITTKDALKAIVSNTHNTTKPLIKNLFSRISNASKALIANPNQKDNE